MPSDYRFTSSDYLNEPSVITNHRCISSSIHQSAWDTLKYFCKSEFNIERKEDVGLAVASYRLRCLRTCKNFFRFTAGPFSAFPFSISLSPTSNHFLSKLSGLHDLVVCHCHSKPILSLSTTLDKRNMKSTAFFAQK